ncbi:MAG: group 1 truncated hemoglobin [Alphaproteobacteria bacterium]|nr:group 1 truncated hemoglobin [Alphaproteobacteria bacterium]MCB9974004.1 group 1 truncated hemoglobin [Rhodospirillales bacterium]
MGGRAAVEAAVDKFYDRILADNRINGFFRNIDVKRQRAKQKAFLTYAFGGAPNYSGKSLRDAHKGLVEKGLNDTHFDIVAGHLQETLKELNVPSALIKEVMDIAGSTRKDVLNR